MDRKMNVLRCPACKGMLSFTEKDIRCNACTRIYQFWKEIPVLLLPENSLFDPPKGSGKKPSRAFAWAKKLLPSMGHNLNAKDGYRRFADLLKTVAGKERAVVMVVGSGRGGIGIEELTNDLSVDLINLDVVATASLDVVGDAHYLPVADGSCDGVIIQAVLEHVLDPNRVVAELFRILKPNGIVYAETPFMQMVHERAYDYTRFSDLGHRHLFRNFTEVDRGITGGAGMTLLWAWCYFLRAFCRTRGAANIALAIGRLTGFWLLWIDRLLRNNPGCYDACSGVYFLGRKTVDSIPAREIVTSFRGL